MARRRTSSADKTELAQELVNTLESAALEGKNPPLPPLGMALVGLGRSGHFHLASIRSLPAACKLLWAVDVDEKRARQVSIENNCQWSTKLDHALADPAVKAVIVASTTDTHFPFIMQSLRAGKAVFAEKPISHEVKEVQEAVDLAISKEIPFVCGYQRRCDRNFRELKRQLEDGAIGKLKVVKSCSRDNPVPPMSYLRTSGGIFQDMLIHDFDVQDWLSDGQMPESVMSMGHCYNDEIRNMDDIDTAAVMCKYPSGLIAITDTCRDAAYGYDQRIEAFGDRGMLTARNEMTSCVELATGEGHLMPPAMYSFPERYKQAYSVEMAEFISLVQAGPKSEAYEAEAQQAKRHPKIVRTALAAELSWRLGRQVMLSEDLEGLHKKLEEERDAKRRRCGL